MNARNIEVLYKIIVIICIFHFSIFNVCAENRHPLWNVENEFGKEGYGLRGPVYSVTNMRMRPIVKLGEVVRTKCDTIGTSFFDENGKIYRSHHPHNYNDSSYQYTRDSVLIITSHDGNIRFISKVIYKYDLNGKIIEAKYYKNNDAYKRIVFEYTLNGYSAVTYGNGDWGYQKNNNKFITVDEMGSSSGTLNSSGQTITTEGKHILGGFHYIYAYNSHGDLISEKNNIRLGIKNITAVKNESGKRYEYVYDDHGNWTEKRTYENGKLKDEYVARKIVYKYPEEILAEKKAEAEKNRMFEEELQRKGEEYANKFVEDYCKQKFKERLTYNANDFTRNSVPIKNFSVTNDSYSFEFSDGTKVDNVRFESIDLWSSQNLISSDMHIVLVPKYTQQGPKWYVVNYGKIADFDFNPNDSIDWVKLYRDKFYSRNNIEEKEIHDLWDGELSRLWRNSMCSSIGERVQRLNKNALCINELVDAYEKGFVSPSSSNKEKEIESLEKYKKFKEDEKRKNLCAIAYSACVFNDKNKPEADKLKKFTCDESGYYFKKKDNNEIVNPKFDTKLSGRDVLVYLSSDKTVALVLKRLYADYYLFIVELDGDNVKSVNFISPKDVMKFQHPTSIEHSYNTGYS